MAAKDNANLTSTTQRRRIRVLPAWTIVAAWIFCIIVEYIMRYSGVDRTGVLSFFQNPGSWGLCMVTLQQIAARKQAREAAEQE
ncbi:hypothetical protein C1Y63_05475 [Corynebacterium sp. 13CS0277]|uniref:hypothetical protein n=1 Tax=Corynebacterium sp. 13CS0277 TaxID=2071994 RepID=UPI000D0228FC|nr:hypothetical protein [Corynebacterium sp. 13CS0277]PRQ11628.1 hypothetical protein C1Y63_05475 [Corynebacterium sp. 13CS0277]